MNFTKEQINQRTLKMLKERGETPGAFGPTDEQLTAGNMLLVEESAIPSKNNASNWDQFMEKMTPDQRSLIETMNEENNDVWKASITDNHPVQSQNDLHNEIKNFIEEESKFDVNNYIEPYINEENEDIIMSDVQPLIDHQKNGTGIYPGKIHDNAKSLNTANNRIRVLNSFDGLPFNHENRNIYNNIPANIAVAKAADWTEMADEESVFHQFGQNGKNNRKFVSPDGLNEVVFRPNGSLESDPRNIGTFNFEPPTNDLGHFYDDVLPYYWSGNGSSDNTSLGDRLYKTIDAFPSPKKYLRRTIDYLFLPRDYFTNHPKNR